MTLADRLAITAFFLAACVGSDPAASPPSSPAAASNSPSATTAPTTAPSNPSPTTTTTGTDAGPAPVCTGVDLTSNPAHCGRCNHDCFGGTCTAGVCGATTITESQPRVQKMLVDGGRLYWTRSVGGVRPGTFMSSKLDGTDVVTIYDAGTYQSGSANPGNTCYGGAKAAGKAYFLCQTGLINSTVLPNAKSGVFDLRVCTLPCAAGSSTVLKSGIENASAVAADPVSGKVYYSVSTPYSAPPSGGVFEGATGNRVGNSNQANTSDVAVANGSVYWLNSGTYDSSGQNALFNGGVKRATVTNPGAESTVVGVSGQYTDLYNLAVDAFNVYYTSPSRKIISAGNTTIDTPPIELADAAGFAVAADGTNVYFDDEVGSALVYCPRTGGGCVGGGGGRKTLSADEPNVATLMVDDNEGVIWARLDGVIRRVAKP